jgi:Protein of unknown function (DUF3631)
MSQIAMSPEPTNDNPLLRAVFSEPEPEPERAPALATLLDATAAAFSRFIVLPAHAADALALWVAHTWAFDSAECSPILAITSPEKRCGKTQVLRLLDKLAREPKNAANITPAAVFRSIEKWRPTLLVDEADTFLDKNTEIRGVLNSGHTKDNAKVIRVEKTEGGEYEPREFSTWAPKAVAAIKKLPDTIMDRAIEIRMRRKLKSEKVARLTPRAKAGLQMLGAKFAAMKLGKLRLAPDPEMPGALNDRAADSWRHLIALADAAGGTWPARARMAARVLSGVETSEDNEQSRGVRLLADIRAIFEKRAESAAEVARQGLAVAPARISSAQLVEKLAEDAVGPWAAYDHGRPLSQAQLAGLLEPFGIEPGQRWIGGRNQRGYERAQFEEAWQRYLPGAGGGVEAAAA